MVKVLLKIGRKPSVYFGCPLNKGMLVVRIILDYVIGMVKVLHKT